MSRPWVVIALVSFAVIGLVNILILLVWLPRLARSPAKAETPITPTGIVQTSRPITPNDATAPSTPSFTPSRAEIPNGFVVERQTMSPSGSLRIKYLRNRKEKLRRITLEDAHQPATSAVLCDFKLNAWLLISPDDQWIALNDHSRDDSAGARLYHRTNSSVVRYETTDAAPAGGQPLQDTVWSTYLAATQRDPQTKRDHVTIDATAWENDSRKLTLSVAYLAVAGAKDIPEPWSCTYDVVSKQVEPESEQTVSSTENASSSPAQQDAEANEDTNPAFAGEKFAATREVELTVPDVNESSLSEITYAINEMFARHGADFRDKQTKKQFSEFSWYQPRAGLTLDQIESEFSDLEKQNLKVLARCRDAKAAAARRQHRIRSARQAPAHEESVGERFLKAILQGVADGLSQ
jgi:hypothetical protein